ncbi:glycosyl transferase [Bacillus cereus]|nr:glycosyl transferase [Bacillus cereus]
MDLLKSRSIEVNLYSVHNDSIKERGLIGKARLGMETIWSYSEFTRLKQYLLKNKPDVVHIHNFFPILSPAVYYACSKLKIPVVQTLHNYRLLCPSAMFMRENKICESCLKGSLFNSIKHGCYRDSKIQTIPIASMITFNRIIGTWNNKVNRYIALTNFAKDKFVEGGIPEDKLVVKPNFLEQKAVEVDINEKYLLFVGRISKEKGVHNLLRSWKQLRNKNNTKLIIIGDGPEKSNLEKEYISGDIKFLGNQETKTVLAYMKSAKYLVVPSIWYEGFPMTIVESFSVGTPVICSNIGSLQEVVEDGITGFHFNNKDSRHLTTILEKALNYDQYELMKTNVFSKFEKNYTPEVNYNQLINIYRDVIKEMEHESPSGN